MIPQLSEFKRFVMKGSVVHLLVGVFIGAAFGKIVSSETPPPPPRQEVLLEEICDLLVKCSS